MRSRLLFLVQGRINFGTETPPSLPEAPMAPTGSNWFQLVPTGPNGSPHLREPQIGAVSTASRAGGLPRPSWSHRPRNDP